MFIQADVRSSAQVVDAFRLRSDDAPRRFVPTSHIGADPIADGARTGLAAGALVGLTGGGLLAAGYLLRTARPGIHPALMLLGGAALGALLVGQAGAVAGAAVDHLKR